MGSATTSEITISLKRNFSPEDDYALKYVMGQWLVYDLKIYRHRFSAEIKLFHTIGAKNDLVAELKRLFPDENISSM